MKVAIIDDESNGRNIIRQYLSQYCQDVEVIGEADSVKSGVELLSKQSPDIVFLDIQMQDGTGFNLLEMLPKRSFKVIFVTSFDPLPIYALKAFRYSAADYLLKPINPDDFAESVQKVRKDINTTDGQKDIRIDELLTNVNSFEKIGLPTNNGIRFIKVDDIVRCEADGSYTIFYFNNTSYLVSKNLKFYEDLLSDRKFLRVHKSHLVNLHHIEQYINGDGGQVVMSDGATIDVLRRKKNELLDMMMN
mgnify:CR=1 FL=1